jgi:hypothetical protein
MTTVLLYPFIALKKLQYSSERSTNYQLPIDIDWSQLEPINYTRHERLFRRPMAPTVGLIIAYSLILTNIYTGPVLRTFWIVLQQFK